MAERQPEPVPREGPLVLGAVLGLAADVAWHDRLHEMEHAGQVEYLVIPEAEAARRRMRLTSDRGRDCAIALPREARIADGSVLYCDGSLAIVARVDSGARLRLRPETLADAMRIGHWCGNLHWKVVFGETWMDVVMEGPEERYRARLRDLADLAGFEVESAAENPDHHGHHHGGHHGGTHP